MAKIARPFPKIALPPIERKPAPTRVANPLVGIQPRRVVFPLFEIEQGPMIPLTQIGHAPLAGIERATQIKERAPDLIERAQGFLNSGEVVFPEMPLDPGTVRITAEEITNRRYNLIDRYNPCGEIPLGPAQKCVLPAPAMPPLVWLDKRPKKRRYAVVVVALVLAAVALVLY